MMFRLVRFLIIALTLGRIKWLMRLTWVWRFVVFLGLTGWLAKRLRRMVGLDKSEQKSDVDSAWAEALRYTPTPAPSGAGPSAGVAYPTPMSKESPVAPESSEPASESLSEVTGYAEDGSSETITIHEVSAEGETETVVRIADDAGNVETVVTGSPVEEIDLANLGANTTEQEQTLEEIVEAEIETESAIDEILDTLEAAEPTVEEAEVVAIVELDPEQPQVKRSRMPKKSQQATAKAPEPELTIDPDWVRGDGSHDCPESHPVKAKASSMIYYVPESGHYDRTIPDVCFAEDIDAEAAGYRAPRR